MVGKRIFSDFDGTLTLGKELGAIFFDILKFIKSKNSTLTIVSGRSISWGHFFVTHTDVEAAIMEGGGVIVYRDHAGHLCEKNLVNDESLSLLKQFCKKLHQNFPDILLSADSFGRRTDRAIELHSLTAEQLENLEKFMEREGINHCVSSVHLNFWVGNISKYEAVKSYYSDFLGTDKIDDTCYFGDALNDESMFKNFPMSVGVSNISPFLGRMKYHPTKVLEGDENKGPLGVYRFLKEYL